MRNEIFIALFSSEWIGNAFRLISRNKPDVGYCFLPNNGSFAELVSVDILLNFDISEYWPGTFFGKRKLDYLLWWLQKNIDAGHMRCRQMVCIDCYGKGKRNISEKNLHGFESRHRQSQFSHSNL